MGKKWKVRSKNKDAVILESRKGNKRVLYTPSGKCKRYKRQLERSVDGNGVVLNDVQIGFRMGYRAALGEQAKIYKAKIFKKKNPNYVRRSQ